MADDRQKRRQELAATLEGRSDEEITQGVVAQGADTVLGQIFSGMSEAVHSYQLKIAGGKCELVKGAAGPARVTLTLQAPDFLRLVTGTLNGMQAFMTGKLKLTGDMMFAQVMQGWFEQ